MRRYVDRLLNRFGYWKQEARSYYAAIHNRLTADWGVTNTNADHEIWTNVRTLRDRCRDLERNNDYARRYLKLLENNVLGANGITLQMKIRETVRGAGGRFVEQFDTRANDLIENAWWMWGKKACDINGRLCWSDMQRLVLRSVARDGAVLLRKHFPNDNPFRFSLELIEIDQLDIDYNATLGDRAIRMGIETDRTGRVIAYHILHNHPGALFQPTTQGRYRESVPASNMLHIFFPERVGQSTGVPWLSSAMLRLNHLSKYEEAEVVAARAGASKMVFLERSRDSAPGGYAGPEDSQGRKYMETDPGSVELLPYGYTAKPFDPTHPNSAFGGFVKSTLRGISAGLGVSYVSLANDLEGVNYSSIRAGLLEEREEWKAVQTWFINWFITPVFEEWLRMALSAGAIKDEMLKLPAAKFDKFNAPEWKPRRWDWVDPLKDLQANVLAVEKGFKSRRSIIAESGGDIEDTFGDIAADEALADEMGLDFSPESGQQANEQSDQPDDPDDPNVDEPPNANT